MLWVATIGIRRAWRDSANVRSSPVGSVSPTVAKAWYSSQTNRRSRQIRSGCGGDLGNALQDGALEVELQHHAERARQSGIQADREVQRQHVARLEQFLERRQRSRFAGLRRRRRTRFSADRTCGGPPGSRRTATGTRRCLR